MTKARDLGDNAQNTKPKVVNAKADLIVGTGSDAADRLAVGNNGETLVADSSASTGLRWQAPVATNPIINGGFDIWQRGTSVAFGTVGGYGADRWIIQRGGWAGGATMSRQTGTSGLTYAARVQRDSGNTSTAGINIQTSVETLNSVPFQGQAVTLSFYARAGANFSSSGNVLAAQLYTGTGTDQNNATTGYTGSVTAISQNATLTTSFQRFSYSATLASNTNEIALAFLYTPVGTAGANDWFEITGIQVEVGSVATPFRRSGGTLAGELAACQRYYWRNSASQAYSYLNQGAAGRSTTQYDAIFQFPVPMRVAATSLDFANLGVTTYAGATTYAVTAAALTNNSQSPNVGTVLFTIGTANLVAGTIYQTLANNNTAAYVAFSAEL